MKKVKRRAHKTADPTWDTHTYSGSDKVEFDMEMIKYFNPREGRNQFIFLYKNKDDGSISKYRILR